MTAATAEMNNQAPQKSQITTWWDRATTPKVIHTNVSLRSAKLVSTLTLATLTIAIAFGMTASILLFPSNFWTQRVFWAGTIATVALIAAYVLSQRGNYYAASTIMVGVVMICPYIAQTDYSSYAPFWSLQGITAASVLLTNIIFPQRKAAVIAAVLVFILTLLLPLWGSTIDFGTIAYPFATVGIIFYFTFLFDSHRTQLEKERQANLVQALQAAERLAAIVEGTSDLVGSAYLDGRNFYLNTAGRQLLGLPDTPGSAEFPISQATTQWSNEIIGKVGIPTALRDGTWNGETALLGASGQEIPVSQTIIAHKNPDGSPAYLSTIARDISQQKHAAEERERLIKDLQAAKRLAEENSRLKSEFLSMMSHELRTPLNAIEGFTSVVLRKIGGAEFNEKTEEFLNRVHSNSQRLLQLINDFLDLSRVESGRLELANQPFTPARLAQRWKDEIGVLADKKGLNFELGLDTSLPETLYGDEEAISKVAINLLSNAIKFTEQGAVSLALDCVDTTWSITVTDTGIGIPPHAREFIFEEFRQVDQTSRRKYGGTGLGLAIVQKYVRSMGGTVNVKSEAGQGSTFTVTLPLKTTA
jgi:signal transduction histidine kinase